MAQLVTWKGIWVTAQALADISTPVTGNSPAYALTQLSMMQHDLQTLTNAVKRHETITIATPTTDGSVAEDLDVKLELDMQIQLTGQTGYTKMNLVTPEMMDQMKRNAADFGAPMAPYDYTTAYYYTIEQGKIWIYPYVGLTGVMDFRYIPNLAWYDPAQPTGDWAGVTPDTLDAYMSTHGPAREFTTATGGMAEYLAAIYIENSGAALGPRYQRLMSEWDQTVKLAIREIQLLNKETTPRPRNGIMM